MQRKGSAHTPADKRGRPNRPARDRGFYTQRFLEDARTLGLKVAHR
jgi:hypothetical protein